MELSQPRRFPSALRSSDYSLGGEKPTRDGVRKRRFNKNGGASSTLLPAANPESWLEPLEQRLLYTHTPGVPMISEFMASNVGGLRDNYNRDSDWIEIRNPTLSNIDLGGYYLTDNAGNLTNWQFPAGAILPGGGYMLVFASGEDDAVAGQPLHTDFQIDSAGGYLALVDPDGTTVLSDYNYPEQVTNYSYGVAIQSSSTTLVNSTGSLVRYFVPTGPISGSWRGVSFNDEDWTTGTTGVGYENDPPPPPFDGFTVRMVDILGGTDGQINNITEAQNILNGTANPGAYTVVSNQAREYSRVNFGGGQSFLGDNVLPNGQTIDSAPGRTDYALRATANVVIPVGQWTIDIGSDEGFRLRIPGLRFIPSTKTGQEFSSISLPQSQTDINETLVYGGTRAFGHTFGTFTVVGQPLVTTIQLDYFERTTLDALELSVALGQRPAFNTTDFTLLADGWNGWDISTPVTNPLNSYSSLINTDVKAEMLNGNTTAYLRLPFVAADPDQFDTLRLRMKYDDGFIAYLNGIKIADRNAPATPAWNSAATDSRADEDAMVFEEIDLPVPQGVMQTGPNVLAIQGLNDASDSPDFLILPGLNGVQTVLVPGDRYMTTPTPGTLNNPSNFAGVVADTKFSHNHGFYDNPFQLTITTDTIGAQIRYTTNGAAPTSNTGTVYSGPITINKTTVVRAAAFYPGSGLNPSDVDTQTYIFLSDVITQSPTGAAPNVGGTQWPTGPVNGQRLDYGMDPDIVNNPTWAATIKDDLKAIPTMNIAIDPNDMFNPSTNAAIGGIWVNPRGDGRGWERPASLELINPDGSEGFQINSGIRVRGGFSRDPNNPKHGFRFFFRDEYGAPKLEYPLFGDDPTAVDEFDKIDLRTFQNYSWSYSPGGGIGTFVRDIMSRDLQLAAGDVSSHGYKYHLYINGQYWGIFETDERPEASNAAAYYGEVPGGYDTVKVESGQGQYDIEATDGDLNAWRELWERSRVPSAAQVDVFSPINVEVGDVFTLTVTGRTGATASVSFTATAATAQNVSTGLAAAWNTSTNPLVNSITATADLTTIKLTGKMLGMPTHISASSVNGGADDTQSLARRTTFTPVAVETGDVFIITSRSYDGSSNASVVYVATVNSVANATAGLADAWNASTHPLHTGITAVDTGTSIVFTADEASVPFYLTGSTSNGGSINSQALNQPVNTIGVAPLSTFQRVQGNNPDGTRNPNYANLLDVDNLINYMLIIYYTGNKDAPISNFLGNAQPNNWFGTRPRDGSHGFRFIAHDSEHTFLPSDLTINRLGPSAGVGWGAGNTFQESNPQYIFQQLWNDPEFQLKVADRIRAMFFDGGILTPASLTAMLNARKLELDRAIVGESARWGDAQNASPYTRNTWLNAYNQMLTGFVNASPNTRTTIVFNQLVNWNLYPRIPGVPATVFNAPIFSQYGGNINNGFALSITNPAGNPAGATLFYTTDGSDPRRQGGEVSPTAQIYSGPIPLNTSTTVNARFRVQIGNNVYWSAVTSGRFRYNLAALHVTEMMYNPAPPPLGSPYVADDFEYIELQNTGTIPLQLNNIHFDEGITFNFPNMVLGGGQRTLVVKNRAAFESRYGLLPSIAGEYIGTIGGMLSNNGEDVKLLGPLNELLIAFNYDNDWYPITSGGGYSLVVRDPNASQLPTPIDPENPLSKATRWRASNLTGGAPGTPDPGINPETIVINEAMSNATAPLFPQGDWIELRNLSTNTPINIGGWFLSNEALDLRKYQIPPNTILQPNSHIVFYAQSSFGNAANPGVNTPFDLDEVNGAAIYLTNNDGAGNVAGYREFADFGVAATGSAAYGSPPNVSFGRYVKSTTATDFAQLISPTPGAANTTAVVGPVVFSEVNYNPTAGGSEFVELQNLSDSPIQLWNPNNPNSTWKILSGIDFTFPTNITIPGFGSVVLVPSTISLAAFRTAYNVPAEIQLFQYSGTLDNGGEDLKLGRPMDLVGGVVPYALVDKVKYADALPWPEQPDGNGPSLQRVQALNYGNDPSNWKAGPFNGNPGFVLAPQRRPIVDIGADASVTQGVAFLRTGSFSDVNTEQTFSGTVNWGDGTPVQALVLNPNKTFSLNHTYPAVGAYTVTVTITDSYPEAGVDTLIVNVTAGNPPVVTAGADVSAVQGDTFSTGGSFTDLDIGQSWFATIDWGAGAAPVPLALTPTKTYNVSHIYANVGQYTVTVKVTDNVGMFGTDTFIVNATPNTIPGITGPADQTFAQGGTFTGAGSFTDPNNQQTWSATINWGDGAATAPLTLNADKTFNLNHLYANPGTYIATVTVTDSVGGAGVDTIAITALPNARSGTSADDTYIVRLDPANPSMIQFFENRTIAQGPSYAIAYSLMNNYTFNAVQGNDALVIDMTSGNPVPAAGINYIGGTSIAPGDIVQIIGSAGADQVHITSAQILIGGLVLDYSAERIQFDGAAGDDTMHIDEAINFSPAFNGGGGNDTIIVNEGTWRLFADAGLTTDNLNIVGNSDAVIIANSSQHIASLTLNGGSRFSVAGNGSRVLRASGLTIGELAVLDLNDNNLILPTTPANQSARLAMINALIQRGRGGDGAGGGAWTGSGIRSTTAANNALRSTGLAAILNNRGDGTVVRADLEGETVDINNILVKYTYNGDTNLDGRIDADDYARIDAGYASGLLTGYFNGDFDYSGGKPDADDYFLIDKAYSDQAAVLSAPAPVAPAAPAVTVSEAPAPPPPSSPDNAEAIAAVDISRTAEKKPRKINRHHKRDVIDQVMPAESRVLQRSPRRLYHKRD